MTNTMSPFNTLASASVVAKTISSLSEKKYTANVVKTKEEALAQGFKWEDTPRGTYGKGTVAWDAIPDSIQDVAADATKEIYECVECKKNYRVIPNELTFYKKCGIPLPRMCPDCRHARRFAARGPNALFDRTCSNCSTPIQTSYSPDRPEILYCESCYNQAFA